MAVARLGFNIAPDWETQRLCAPLYEQVDYLELLPESLVAPWATDAFVPNDFFRAALDLQQRTGVAMVAHGVGLSLAGAHPHDGPRTRRWLGWIEALHQHFGFEWYTDHWGLTAPGGLNLTLPLGGPATTSVVAAAREKLAALQDIVGLAGVENSVFYAPLCPPEREAAVLTAVVEGAHGLLLDVHNLYVHQHNLGLDIDAWLDQAPLSQVVEIHVSGGADSAVGWLPEGRQLRLDSHDNGVPEPVFALLQQVLPRCGALRGVTLERLEGTVQAADVPQLEAELGRIRDLLPRAGTDPDPPRAIPALQPDRDWPRLELALADVLSGPEPLVALRRLAEQPWLCSAHRHSLALALAHPDGVRMSALLVAQLRFQRLLRGSTDLEGWFDRDPGGFTRAFRTYAETVPPTAFLPADEAALFAASR